MKSILIIYPHWHPSNLAGVHRPRLIGNYLKELGWEPHILTVKQEFFEEKPDRHFHKLFSDSFIEYRVDAFHPMKPRVFGDIGLRAFFQLKRKALEILDQKNIDFVWIPIPSFYTALLGRILYNKTKVPYGIDYIDPWVRDISNHPDLRARLSQFVARTLEPIAVKRAALISGVSFEYYRPVLERNQLIDKVEQVAMPYGFDPNDHRIRMQGVRLPWEHEKDIIPLVYAGAFLPNSGPFLNALFKVVRKLKEEGKLSENVRFYFIGTGHYPHKGIMQYAKEQGVEHYVVEIKDRFPFLEILHFLASSAGVFVLGSTEKHYTASKIFQSLLSGQKLFAMFHYESTVNDILADTKANQFLVKYNPSEKDEDLFEHTYRSFYAYLTFEGTWNPELTQLDQYSSKESARKLVEKMNLIVTES